MVVLVLGFWVATPRPASAANCTNPGTSDSDFDGDGCSDLAVGVHGEDIGSVVDAGGVNVLYGDSTGIITTGDQFWNQDSTDVTDQAEQEDVFGRSLESGDFNGDGYSDLAVGVYQESFPNLFQAGAVHVFYGSSSGLLTTDQQFWTEADIDLESVTAQPGDFFGRALAAGNFNGDFSGTDHPYDDLAIGADGDFVGTANDAGSVIVLYGSSDGLQDADPVAQEWDQGDLDTDGVQAGDQFGVALAAGNFDGDESGYEDLAVGAIAEGVGSAPNAGAVSVIFGSANGLETANNQFVTQDTDEPGNETDLAENGDAFGRDLTAGDFNGDAIDDLAIGARNEDVVDVNDEAGAATIMQSASGEGLATGMFVTEEDLEAEGQGEGSESNDDFGRGLDAGDFNGDTYDDLAMGVDNEDFTGTGCTDGVCNDAGAIHVVDGSDTGIDLGTDVYRIQTDLLDDLSDDQDAFGKDFEVADFDGNGFEDLVISAWKETLYDHVPAADVALAGIMHVVYGSDTGGLDYANSEVGSQDTTGVEDIAEAGDEFGWFG